MSCWIITDGKAGMENQCLGLAERLGLEPIVKRVRLKSPWRQLSPYVRLGARLATSRRGDGIDGPPWPAVLIASGRLSVLSSVAVRRASGGRTFTVQIQDPAISPRHFDMVVVPRHDRVRGANVLVTRGALHRVTPARLSEAASRFAAELAWLPSPRVAVLIGGDNAVFRLTPVVMGDLAEKLSRLAKRDGAGLMVTPSRRTGGDNEAILRARLRDIPSHIWDGVGENPYFAYLGLADAIVVTGDSVSMVSEAAATGKPVYVVDLEGGSPKFAAFHEGLRRDGITRPFTGELERWTYAPLDDAAAIAVEVGHRLRKHTATVLPTMPLKGRSGPRTSLR